MILQLYKNIMSGFSIIDFFNKPWLIKIIFGPIKNLNCILLLNERYTGSTLLIINFKQPSKKLKYSNPMRRAVNKYLTAVPHSPVNPAFQTVWCLVLIQDSYILLVHLFISEWLLLIRVLCLLNQLWIPYLVVWNLWIHRT